MVKIMGLAAKIGSGVGILILIVLGIGLMALVNVRSLGGHVTEIGTNLLPSVGNLQVINEAQTAVDGAENALLSPDLSMEMRQGRYEAIAAAWARADAALKVYEGLPKSAEEEATWQVVNGAGRTPRQIAQTGASEHAKHNSTVKLGPLAHHAKVGAPGRGQEMPARRAAPVKQNRNGHRPQVAAVSAGAATEVFPLTTRT